MNSDSAPDHAALREFTAQLEATLRLLTSVTDVHVQCDAEGRVQKVSILSDGTQSAKQVVRDVEAALAARHSVKIDHRAVSIATARPATATPSGAPSGTPPISSPLAPAVAASLAVPVAAVSAPLPPVFAPSATAVTPLYRGALMRAYTLEAVEVQWSRSAPRSCRVTLSRGDKQFVGDARVLAAAQTITQLAVDATLSALCVMDARVDALHVEGVKQLTSFERPCVVVSLLAPLARGTTALLGIAEVAERPEVAAATAVLDATNRWLAAGLATPSTDGRG